MDGHAFSREIEGLWESRRLIYSGYVDDPRNTDNAWVETMAYHFHCTDEAADMLKLNRSGDEPVRPPRHPGPLCTSCRSRASRRHTLDARPLHTSLDRFTPRLTAGFDRLADDGPRD